MRLRAGLLWLAAACAPALCAAEETRVVSTHRDSVSITIYRDLFALVTETRTVDLPAGPVTLVFDGVVETLIPQSALMTGAARSTVEANFDYTQLTRAQLLRNSVGRRVLLTRTDRATGEVRQTQATVTSAGTDGVVFHSADGGEALHCSGQREQLTFDEQTIGSVTRPALSVRLAAGTPGRRELRLSYLAHGFAWSADYLARVAPGGSRMDLMGWLTLRNLTGASLKGARVQVVAGQLNLLDAKWGRGTSVIGETGSSTEYQLYERRKAQLEHMLRELNAGKHPAEKFFGCYPLGRTRGTPMVDAINAEDISVFRDMNAAQSVMRSAAVTIDAIDATDSIVVTGFRTAIAVREQLSEYQLYRLPMATDLAARQTKQVAFIDKRDVRIERFYGVRLASNDQTFSASGEFVPASVRLGWRNRARDGLGEPLPGGLIRVFESQDLRSVFAGDARLADCAVDAPVEISIGMANGVGVVVPPEDTVPVANRLLARITGRSYLPLELRVVNPKPAPVDVEIRQGLMWGRDTVRRASREPSMKHGDYAWRLTVPAGGDARLRYELGGRLVRR